MTDNIQFYDKSYLIFDNDGHLTNQAFQCLINESLSPMQSLEVSEHLSYCDECLTQYTNLLCEDSYITPLQPLSPDVMRQIKRIKHSLYVNKFFSATIASSFALIYCIGNMFMSDYSFRPDRIVDHFRDSSQIISQETQKIADGISTSFNNIWYEIIEFGLKNQ